MGDPDLTCRGVSLLPGAPGVEMQIAALGNPEVDVLITGEVNEWETSEYVRDAVYVGDSKGLVVIGHAASEEPGIKRMVPWLQKRLPDVPIHFVPVGDPFLAL
jgi:putative NIF3 family GTP cyclohydrolase 1 type 2